MEGSSSNSDVDAVSADVLLFALQPWPCMEFQSCMLVFYLSNKLCKGTRSGSCCSILYCGANPNQMRVFAAAGLKLLQTDIKLDDSHKKRRDIRPVTLVKARL